MKKIRISMTQCKYYRNVFRCGYDELDNILRDYPAMFYNAGEFGWNCDIYVDSKHDLIITTGYRNMRGDKIPEHIIDKFNKLMDNRTSYEQISEIREQFFSELAQLNNRW